MNVFSNEAQSIVNSVLLQSGLIADATVLSQKIVSELKRHFAGEMIYIQKSQYDDLEVRNLAIVTEFNGNNQRELAKKYDLSTGHVYKVLKDHYVSQQASLI